MYYIIEHIRLIIDEYKGDYPLATWLKNYYKAHHQLGSRDRKAISEAVFLYYRFKNRLPVAADSWQAIEQAAFHTDLRSPYLKKVLENHNTGLSPVPLLTETGEMPAFSAGMDKQEWIEAFATQPALFIRVRQHMPAVCQLLESHAIPYEHRPYDILKLPNSAAINTLLPEQDYVIQDQSSQQSVRYFTEAVKKHLHGHTAPAVWDVCAGAGGKTIFIKDHLPQARVTSSDIRKSILQNLRKRAESYRQQGIHSLVLNSADAHEIQQKLGSQCFDAIICDVPCSGSGTWQRTPENWAFMELPQLNSFPSLQLKIASHAMHRLKNGGIFAYITCSVFQQENEDIVSSLTEMQPDATLLHQGIINGLSDQADSLFCAVLKKSR